MARKTEYLIGLVILFNGCGPGQIIPGDPCQSLAGVEGVMSEDVSECVPDAPPSPSPSVSDQAPSEPTVYSTPYPVPYPVSVPAPYPVPYPSPSPYPVVVSPSPVPTVTQPPGEEKKKRRYKSCGDNNKRKWCEEE